MQLIPVVVELIKVKQLFFLTLILSVLESFKVFISGIKMEPADWFVVIVIQ